MAMKKTSEHGDTLELYALAYIAKMQIHIYQHHKLNVYKLTQKIPCTMYQDTKPLLLLYTPETKKQQGHYDLLVRRDEQPLEDRWQRHYGSASIFPVINQRGNNPSLVNIIQNGKKNNHTIN